MLPFEFGSLFLRLIYKLSLLVSYHGPLAAQGVPQVQNHARILTGGEEEFLRDFVLDVRRNHPHEKECEYCSVCYPFDGVEFFIRSHDIW